MDWLWRYRVDICYGAGELRLLGDVEVVPLVGLDKFNEFRKRWDNEGFLAQFDNLGID